MIQSQPVALFLTHAIRYHDDWNRLFQMLNARDAGAWRIVGQPIIDSALSPQDVDDRRVIRKHLEAQILSAQAVILFAGVYREAGTWKWVDFEIDTANKHGKPIIGLPSWGEATMSEETRHFCDIIAEWKIPSLLEAVRKVCQETSVSMEPARIRIGSTK